jgi:hypothetical protein
MEIKYLSVVEIKLSHSRWWSMQLTNPSNIMNGEQSGANYLSHGG